MRILLGRLATVLIVAFCTFTFVTLAVVPMHNWVEASGWESREAILESAEIVEIGRNTKNSRLAVKYRYSWNAEAHEGYVITPYHPSQRMPVSLQRTLLKQFKEEAERKTLRTFVNPDNPRDSILTREFYPDWYTWNLYLLVLALFISYGAFWVVRLAMETDNTNKDAPITSQEKYESPFWKLSAYFAGLFSLISLAMIKIVLDSVQENNYSALAFLLFPAAAILLWWLTRYAWLNRFDINKHTSPITRSTADLRQRSE